MVWSLRKLDAVVGGMMNGAVREAQQEHEFSQRDDEYSDDEHDYPAHRLCSMEGERALEHQ
jgi:hypothetical protein